MALAVKIEVRDEGPYRTEFIGTKKDYDSSSRVIEVGEAVRNPARKIDVYSDSIDTILDTVEGTAGSYTLRLDDLYRVGEDH